MLEVAWEVARKVWWCAELVHSLSCNDLACSSTSCGRSEEFTPSSEPRSRTSLRHGAQGRCQHHPPPTSSIPSMPLIRSVACRVVMQIWSDWYLQSRIGCHRVRASNTDSSVSSSTGCHATKGCLPPLVSACHWLALTCVVTCSTMSRCITVGGWFRVILECSCSICIHPNTCCIRSTTM
jgi:cellulase/cellobiase CelA1